jgi:hypothetical protein
VGEVLTEGVEVRQGSESAEARSEKTVTVAELACRARVRLAGFAGVQASMARRHPPQLPL